MASRPSAIARSRAAVAGAAVVGVDPGDTVRWPRFPCGVTAAPGVSVDVLHNDTWCPGVIASVTATALVAQFGTVLHVSGQRPQPHCTDPMSHDEALRRLRLRASVDQTPSPSRASCCVIYDPRMLIPDVVAYRTAVNRETRRRARAAAERRALARSLIFYTLVLGVLAVQLPAISCTLGGVSYFVELYSGPYRSVSCAVQQFAVGIATVTVDINSDFFPDVVADLQTWSLWAWLLRETVCWGSACSVFLPSHLHFSPPCTTFGRACHFHGRSQDYPGGFHDSADGVAASRCAFAIAFLLGQLLHHGLGVTYTIENPLRSLLWWLPCMQPLLYRSTVLDVSYCMFGSGIHKTTRFLCHPSMEFPWATLVADSEFHRHYTHMCPMSPSAANFNCCGAIVPSTTIGTNRGGDATPEFSHVGRECAFSIFDADIPLGLGALLVRSSVAARASPHLIGRGALTVPRALVCKLAAEWELVVVRTPWVPSISFSGLLSHQPDVAVAAGPLLSPASLDTSGSVSVAEAGEMVDLLLDLGSSSAATPPTSSAPVVVAQSTAPVAAATAAGLTTAVDMDVVVSSSSVSPAAVASASLPGRPRRAVRACDSCGTNSGALFNMFVDHASFVICGRCRSLN